MPLKFSIQELLPFLIDGVDDEDEVLAAIASSLGKLVPHVGGPSRAYTLLPALELLLAVEESTVRDRASESTLIVADALPQEPFQDQYAEMMARLATREWFTARISACGLIAKGFGRLTSDQQVSIEDMIYERIAPPHYTMKTKKSKYQ